MKRSVTGRNRLAAAHLVEIIRDILTTEATLPELIHNNTDFMVIYLLGFINHVVVGESIISRLLMWLFMYDICMCVLTYKDFTNWLHISGCKTTKYGAVKVVASLCFQHKTVVWLDLVK